MKYEVFTNAFEKSAKVRNHEVITNTYKRATGVSKRTCITLCMSFLAGLSAGQGLMNNGAYIWLGSNSYIVVRDSTLGNFENRGGGVVVSEGTIDLQGSWLNNGSTAVFITNSGTVNLSGGNQIIGGITPTFFNNLRLSGSGTKKLLIHTAIGGIDPLNRNGVLDLGGRILALNGQSCFISNSSTSAIQRSTGYILDDSTDITFGKVAWRTGVNVNGKNYLIPYGRQDGNYIPFSINFTTDGSGGDSSGFIATTYRTQTSAIPSNRPLPSGVSSLNNPFGIDHSENTLDRFWMSAPFGFSSNPSGDLVFGYAEDEWDTLNGSENIIFENELGTISNVSGQWQFPPAGTVDILNNRLTVTGKSPFGIFTLANPVECPKSWFTFNNTCQLDNALFSDSSTFRKGYIRSYDWNFGDASTSADSFPQHAYAGYGNFLVSHQVTLSSGCIDSVKRNITIYPKPVAKFDFNGYPCLNTQLTFNDLSTTPQGVITSRSWDFGNGGFSTSTNPQVTFNPTGSYRLQLISENSFSCRDTLKKTLRIFDNPKARFNISDLCSRDTAFIVNTSLATDAPLLSFSWKLGDGSTSTQTNPHKKYAAAGNYTIELLVTDTNHCIDSTFQSIDVYPSATAQFDFDPKNADFLKPVVNFFNQSLNSSSWTWQFGDGSISSKFNETHTFPDTGYYTVQLTADNIFDCPDTISRRVYIEPVFLVFIPSAFTPNTDLLNETFGVEGLPMGAHNCRLSIYNRWGQLIFRGNDIKERWNGTYLGDPVAPGNYTYEFMMDDYKGAAHHYSGIVTLLR